MQRRMRAIDQELTAQAFDTENTESVYRGNRAAFLRMERLSYDSTYRRLELDLYGEGDLYRFDPLQADSIQAILEGDEAIVVYNLRTIGHGATEREASVAYVLLPDTVIVRDLRLNSHELTETIRFFREHIGVSNQDLDDGWQIAAMRLYRDLMTLGRFPIDIYAEPIRWALTVVVPE